MDAWPALQEGKTYEGNKTLYPSGTFQKAFLSSIPLFPAARCISSTFFLLYNLPLFICFPVSCHLCLSEVIEGNPGAASRSSARTMSGFFMYFQAELQSVYYQRGFTVEQLWCVQCVLKSVITILRCWRAFFLWTPEFRCAAAVDVTPVLDQSGEDAEQDGNGIPFICCLFNS